MGADTRQPTGNHFPHRQPMPSPALRQWIWLNLGFDVYDWEPEELRF